MCDAADKGSMTVGLSSNRTITASDKHASARKLCSAESGSMSLKPSGEPEARLMEDRLEVAANMDARSRITS